MTSEGNKQARRAESGGRFAYEGLDRLIHEKARLGIMTSLATRPGGLLFNDLKELCSLTDGNLSRHLAVLAEAALIEVWKGYNSNRAQTKYVLTSQGRRRFLQYVGVLENVVADAVATRKQARPVAGKLFEGWSPA